MSDAASLLALLDRFRPADDVEAGHAERIRRLLAGPGAFDRERYDPGHVTASAFVLHPEEPAVALIDHAALGRRLQPGGHVETHDPDVEAAARREVQEETGIGVLVGGGLLDLDVHEVPARGTTPAHLHFDVRWWFRAGTDRIEAGDGTLGAHWVPISEARTMEPSIARPVGKLAGTLPGP